MARVSGHSLFHKEPWLVYSSHSLINDDLIADSILKIVALVAVIVVVNTAWLLFGAAFSKLLSNPKLGRIANMAFAVMLLLSVAFAMITIWITERKGL